MATQLKFPPVILRQASPDLKRAQAILSGAREEPEQVFKLAKVLKDKEHQFGYARKLVSLLRRHEKYRDSDFVAANRLKLAQQHALLTYKDPDLPNDVKFTRALEILRLDAALETTNDQETLGLAGAVYKRRAEAEGQKAHLERALAYYYEGYKQGVANDYGYTAINAAYVLDLLAAQEDEEVKEVRRLAVSSADRRQKAREIREDIVKELPKLVEQDATLESQWWFLVTLAEAYFGLAPYDLAQYDLAKEWLTKAAALEQTAKWEFETTARQLAALARLQSKGNEDSPQAQKARATVGEFLSVKQIKNPEAALRSAFNGKVGLALSGGGFRASFFHIGVLAKLADIGVLNRIEALSCVSGGSIIGAHYYLELRRLFAEKHRDEEFEPGDYIQIVKNLERDFLAGVQTNIRTNVAGDAGANLKMFLGSKYSRTMRVGELYEQNIYARVQDDGQRRLNCLTILPWDEWNETASFSPKSDNWLRRNKVPILLLNATSLNTGHNWQFTARYMGEPPATINTEIDASYRLRRMYYDQAPQKHQTVNLGFAVGASSCVPGIFEPLPLAELYPDNLVVRLVDGGVFDNQGTPSLLEQDCNVLLVSDASGQMTTVDNPADSLFDVVMRASTISQERIRWAEYDKLEARRRAGLLRGLMFIHLRKDLGEKGRDWLGCLAETDCDSPPPDQNTLTDYYVSKKAQRLLSAVRTDLDSFSDGEAYALMASGYLMTELEFKTVLAAFPDLSEDDRRRRSEWRFLEFAEALQQPDNYSDFHALLGVANQSAFKIWRLAEPLRRLIRSVVWFSGFLVATLLTCWYLWPEQFKEIFAFGLVTFRLGENGWGFTLRVGYLFGLLFFGVLAKVFTASQMALANKTNLALKLIVRVLGGLLAWGAARLHIRWFDRWYLDFGKAERLLGKTVSNRGE